MQRRDKIIIEPQTQFPNGEDRRDPGPVKGRKRDMGMEKANIGRGDLEIVGVECQ